MLYVSSANGPLPEGEEDTDYETVAVTLRVNADGDDPITHVAEPIE